MNTPSKLIRGKISTKETEFGLQLTIEWIEVAAGEVPGKMVAKEEIILGPESREKGYVTRVGFTEGMELPGTFLLRKDGKRDFLINADACEMQQIGGKSSLQIDSYS